MEKNKIKFGLPVGSLNLSGRAETYTRLKEAGLYLIGYEPGREDQERLKIKNKDLQGFHPLLIRPQNLPMQIAYNFLDIGISGDDCVIEGIKNGYNGQIEKLCTLGIGKVKIVVVAHKKHQSTSLSDLIEKYHSNNKILRCFTEYPNIAFNHISENKTYKQIYGEEPPALEIKGIKTGGKNKNIQIIYSFGKSESLVGEENIGVENIQTGSTIRVYELVVLEEIMASEAGLFTGRNLKKDQWKYEQIEILKNLIESTH